MSFAQKSDTDCPNCGSSEVWEFTKGGESTRRLECDDCYAEWSEPA